MGKVFHLFGDEMGSASVSVDDGDPLLTLHLPWIRPEPIDVRLPNDTADELAHMLLREHREKVRRDRIADDLARGRMIAALHGVSRDRKPYVVTRCTVEAVSTTRFSVRFRVIGTADWIPMRHRLIGEEFEVSRATGEQVPKTQGRRWWCIVEEYMTRLKTTEVAT